MAEYRIRSILRARPAEVWAEATSLDAINRELAPLLSMGGPPGVDRLDDFPDPVGRPLFQARLMLVAIIPVGRVAGRPRGGYSGSARPGAFVHRAFADDGNAVLAS